MSISLILLLVVTLVRLAIFAFDQNNVIQPRRELLHFLQRRFLHRFINWRAQHCSQVFGALRGTGQGL